MVLSSGNGSPYHFPYSAGGSFEVRDYHFAQIDLCPELAFPSDTLIECIENCVLIVSFEHKLGSG